MKSTEFAKKYKNIKLETEHLIIRPPQKKDVKDIYNALQDPVFSKNISTMPYPYKMSDAEKYVKLSRELLNRREPSIMLVLYNKKDKRVIGTETLNWIDLKNLNCESGSWIAKPYWGSGLMAEARLEVFKFAFNKLKLHKIYSNILIYNIRSQKHIEKFGFKKQGIQRDEKLIKNKYYSMYCYDILSSEFNYNKLKKKLLRKQQI